MGTMIAHATTVATQSHTSAPVDDARRDEPEMSGRTAARAANAPTMSGHTNMKLTPGSFHVTNTVRMAHMTSAPAYAATTEAHRLTIDQPASVVASATNATAAV